MVSFLKSLQVLSGWSLEQVLFNREVLETHSSSADCELEIVALCKHKYYCTIVFNCLHRYVYCTFEVFSNFH